VYESKVLRKLQVNNFRYYITRKFMVYIGHLVLQYA